MFASLYSDVYLNIEPRVKAFSAKYPQFTVRLFNESSTRASILFHLNPRSVPRRRTTKLRIAITAADSALGSSNTIIHVPVMTERDMDIVATFVAGLEDIALVRRDQKCLELKEALLRYTLKDRT